MSLWGLAFSNFKRSAREYSALVIALAFSVLIFFNFQNVIYSDALDTLRNERKDYIDLVVNAATVVFGVFLFFFIWYSTNVFLNQRKKEIGIYTFMGLDNTRIGKMYALEAVFLGLLSLILGIVLGIVFSKLFQMVLLWLSDIHADVKFSFALEPIMITGGVFLLFFILMTVKGYVSIVRSSVLSLLSDSRKKEMKEKKGIISAVQVLFGLLVLGTGFWAALKTGDIASLGYALAAVVLVIFGVYMVFGGAIPVFLCRLTDRKNFLYCKQRNLWVNNLAYRVRQNYRTYAMVTVLMISAVTVLAMSIAMKQRYERMVHFSETFTYQVVSTGKELNFDEIRGGIERNNEVAYGSELSYLMLSGDCLSGEYDFSSAGFVACSEIRQAAREAGLPFPYEDLKEGEAVLLSHVMLMSFKGSEAGKSITVNGQELLVTAEDSTAYMGDIQSQLSAFMISDEDYAKLKPLGEELHLYNYKIQDPANAEASADYLRSLSEYVEGQWSVGVNIIRPEGSDKNWIRIFYSLCVFMFVTLILAGGSIIFIKLDNDAYTDRQR